MRIISILSAASVAALVFGQQPVPESNVVIRTSTREVLLEVMVRDARGRLVPNVDQGQVEIYENGVRQQIRSFRLVKGSQVRVQNEQQAHEPGPANSSNPSASPQFNPLRTINVVCLVMNDLTPDTRAFAFDAAKRFLNKELRPDTFIGVFSLDAAGMRPVFPFSNNRERLLKAVELAAVNQLPTVAGSTQAMLNGLSINTSALNESNGGMFGGPPGAVSASANDTVTSSGDGGGTSDGSSAHDPLGPRGDTGIANVTAMREIDMLTKLVRQLTPLPFQKTVLLMSTGLTRPTEQLSYWNALIRSANQGGVTFYGVDVYGLGVCQDSSNNDCIKATTATSQSVALLQRAGSISQSQSTVGLIKPGQGGSSTPNGGPGGALMEAARQSDYQRFAVSSANTQEALRELSESTGGFVIANTNNTEKLLARVMDDVDTHYEISYQPASKTEDGHFRKIEVKLARADLRVQTRSGYFAIPDTGPLTPEDIAGLRALDTRPLPHAFDFQSKAFRFRSDAGTSQYAIAFQVPISNLTATPEPSQKKQRFHASLLALVKNSQGDIVEKVSKDVPSEVSDQYVAKVRADVMSYEHAVSLAPGHYTIETAVVDQEGNRASTNVLEIDNREQPGLGVSDIALVHRVQNLQRPPDPADPFEIPGRRASPFVSTALPAGAEAFVYFVVYPEKKSATPPELRAQFVRNGHVLATQNSVLPASDESGAVPMAIRAITKPGSYEVKILVTQDRSTVQQSLKYTIGSK